MKYVHTVEIVKLDFLVMKISFHCPFMSGVFLHLEPGGIWQQNCERFFLNNKISKKYERMTKEETAFF